MRFSKNLLQAWDKIVGTAGNYELKMINRSLACNLSGSKRLRKAEMEVPLREAVNGVAAGGLRDQELGWVEKVAVIDT